MRHTNCDHKTTHSYDTNGWYCDKCGEHNTGFISGTPGTSGYSVQVPVCQHTKTVEEPLTPSETETLKKFDKKFWEMLASNQFVKSTNSITDKVLKYPPAIVDMEAIVSIHGEFDKYAIDEWLLTQLRLARADERKQKDRVLICDGIRTGIVGTVGGKKGTSVAVCIEGEGHDCDGMCPNGGTYAPEYELLHFDEQDAQAVELLVKHLRISEDERKKAYEDGKNAAKSDVVLKKDIRDKAEEATTEMLRSMKDDSLDRDNLFEWFGYIRGVRDIVYTLNCQQNGESKTYDHLQEALAIIARKA